MNKAASFALAFLFAVPALAQTRVRVPVPDQFACPNSNGESVDSIIANDTAERAMQIEPRELAERIRSDEELILLDVRTREEWETVKLPGAHLFTQELMQEILSKWPREDLVVIYDHQGTRSMDAAAYFQGHGFTNVKSLRGGIDAFSSEVDSSLPRYHLEEP
jgi:rhodanese-related sulfurtransferase